MENTRLKMKTFEIEVYINPSNLERALGAASGFKTLSISGYTLKDAKKRNNIE